MMLQQPCDAQPLEPPVKRALQRRVSDPRATQYQSAGGTCRIYSSCSAHMKAHMWVDDLGSVGQALHYHLWPTGEVPDTGVVP